MDETSMADNLTPKQRSYCMSRIKGKDTGLERLVRSELHARGWRFRKHVANLPGKPDIVFAKAKVVVFIDGDFWHGYRFPTWKHQVTDFWQQKIWKTRERDQRNFRKLRRLDWQVIRIWQHEIKRDLRSCIEKIETTVNQRLAA